MESVTSSHNGLSDPVARHGQAPLRHVGYVRPLTIPGLSLRASMLYSRESLEI